MQKGFWKKCLQTGIITITFLLINVRIKAQQFHFRNYSVREGIAQSQVYSILQDSRGYLWMGTRGGGISRYDGNSFKNYSVKDGLINNYVFCISEDKQHNLWIGTNDGLSCFNGIEFKNYKPEGSSMLWVQQIAFDKSGNMWLATNNGIQQFKNGRFGIPSFKGAPLKEVINALYIDKLDNVWGGYARGLIKITPQGQLTRFGKEQGFKTNSVTTICGGPEGTIWIGTYGDGVYVYNGRSFRRIDHQQELYKKTILDIYPDKNGNMCLSTLSDGVCFYNLSEHSFKWFSEADGLSNNHVRCVLQDNCGNYWFGTSGGGVSNYSGQQFTHFDKNNGLSGNFIYSVFKDSRGRLWTGTSDKGVCLYDSSHFTCFGAASGFLDVKVKGCCEDDFGNIYLGTDGQGLYVYNGKEFTPINELKRAYVRSLVKDREGKIWCATAGLGIYCITPLQKNGFEIKRLTTEQGLPNNRLNCLYADKNNQIWFGTENHGLGCIENFQVSKLLDQSRGLPSNAIRCLTEDKAGYLWAGTAGNGICRINLRTLKPETFDYTKGLSSNNIYLLVCDDAGNLYAGNESGLDKLRFNSDNNLVETRHYGKAEGFTGIETCQNSVHKDNQGILWFGTINGLTRFDTHSQTKNTHPPILQFNDIRLFYESLRKTAYAGYCGNWNQLSKALQLPYTQNHLTFDFTGINLSNPENVKYSWRLQGLEQNWSPPSTQHSATYPNLSPGDYTFLVKAANEDNVWNEEPLRLHFTIRSPFWMQWWFIATSVLILTLIVFFIFKWRIRIVKRKAEQQQQQLRLEKELLELEQKALRLQMNPHFIFNALNSIQSQIGTNNEQSARYYLAKFSRLMRQILDNSRSTSITLEEEINMLENYLLIEKFCNGDRFDYRIQVDENIEKDYITIPPMLLQPFVENAIKHGLKQVQQGMITIAFRLENDLLECSVSDNGIGRRKAAELKEKSKEAYHQSAALSITEERLKHLQLGPDFHTLEIIDLYTENGEAAGTKVVVRLPV